MKAFCSTLTVHNVVVLTVLCTFLNVVLYWFCLVCPVSLHRHTRSVSLEIVDHDRHLVSTSSHVHVATPCYKAGANVRNATVSSNAHAEMLLSIVSIDNKTRS